MRATSKVMLAEAFLLLIMMLGFCAFAMAASVNGDTATKDVAGDGILADGYSRSNNMPRIVNIEDLGGANKISIDDGRITILKESEL